MLGIRRRIGKEEFVYLGFVWSERSKMLMIFKKCIRFIKLNYL
jgi:hypothetical protein